LLIGAKKHNIGRKKARDLGVDDETGMGAGRRVGHAQLGQDLNKRTSRVNVERASHRHAGLDQKR